ncbi:Benzylsuccinate synthase alpha subunit [Pelotomaculum schinkii]|uniref:Benzylsuccinate synthase alpha subunit n=1 Tax=Pelotomaculum schinkii TaxID=78350 RepID=A0A4Y7RAK7_9FIRM|nr:formate C-acetyltransferase/glycerol dehydratase family glycyl radical enzyme [Pelotomaculum schinkii]TEB05713.1 Benzylsuccinate synthase alpha subunit [Pelotomaculum schinkii]
MCAIEKSFYAGPCGVEPYDKEWGVGVSGMVDNPSPYPRINRMLKWLDAVTPGADHERACLVTEAYQKHNYKPQIVKCAEALSNVLRNVTVRIYPDELIVGEIAAPAKSASVFPEFSFNWIVDEIKNNPWENRTHDVHVISEETEKRLLELADYWSGKTVEEQIKGTCTDEELKGCQMGKGVYFSDLYMYGGVGHVCANYEMLFKQGFGGLKKKVEEKLAGINPSLPEDIKKRNFYQAQLIVVDASIEFIKRYAWLAREMAVKEQDATRKKELLQIADNCAWVSENPPRTFWEAIQLYHLATNIILIESNGHSVTYGRFDQLFYPFYKNDMKNGTVTKDFVQELIENFFIKLHELNKLRDTGNTMVASDTRMGGTALDVGGVDRKGHDATNDLSFMVLDAHAHTRIPNPWMAVRFHANTPVEFKIKVFNVIRIGTGEPKILNDEVNIPAAMAYGRTLEDARDYVGIGCVEPDAAGKEYGWHDATYFNMAKVFEMAINNGRCIGCGSTCPRWEICGSVGKRLGAPTGSLADFKSFDEVLDAYDKQMNYWCDRLVSMVNIMDLTHQALKPLPYLSLLIDDCTEKGVDVTAGGARYNFSGPQGVGTGTVGDGLSTIKQLVFEEKKVTGAELLKAVENNWEGYEPLYALVNSKKVHHYGNDDDYADELANFALSTYCKNLGKRPNAHGGVFVPGVFSVSVNVGAGFFCGASVDGRKAFEPVSDCLGPVHTYAGSHDVNGPTAIANSVSKLDLERVGNGTILNWKFTPTCLTGETGRDNLISVIDGFFEKKGMQSQFNVVSRETLLAAQANPERYKGLLVRVAGYSAYFVQLSKELQDDIIGRTELSFD